MPELIFKEIKKKIKLKKIKKPKILIMGLTFKENCHDTRNSKVLNLYNFFKRNNFEVSTYDPFYKLWDKKFIDTYNIKNKINPKSFDVIVLAVRHDEFLKNKYKINKYLSKDGFIYDLKYILPEKLNHYRL